MSEDLKKSSAATIQRDMFTIPRLPDGQPRHARGWHMVGWSDEFEVGKPVPRDYFGQRLVVYRGRGRPSTVPRRVLPAPGCRPVGRHRARQPDPVRFPPLDL